MSSHFRWNQIFSFRWLVNFWYKTKLNLVPLLFLYDHFDRNEIPFRVTNCHVKTNRNEIIRKETSVHAFISSKQEWLVFAEWAVFLGPSPKQNFISFRPQLKVLQIGFIYMVRLNSVLGRFHFEFHVNSL